MVSPINKKSPSNAGLYLTSTITIVASLLSIGIEKFTSIL